MKKILLIDSNDMFLHDVDSRTLLGGYDDLEVICRKSVDTLSKAIEASHPDMIVINQKLMDSYDWDFGIPIRCYGRTERDVKTALHNENSSKIPCFGLVETANDLLNAILSDNIVTLKQNEKTHSDPKTEPQKPEPKQQEGPKPILPEEDEFDDFEDDNSQTLSPSKNSEVKDFSKTDQTKEPDGQKSDEFRRGNSRSESREPYQGKQDREPYQGYARRQYRDDELGSYRDNGQRSYQEPQGSHNARRERETGQYDRYADTRQRENYERGRRYLDGRYDDRRRYDDRYEDERGERYDRYADRSYDRDDRYYDRRYDGRRDDHYDTRYDDRRYDDQCYGGQRDYEDRYADRGAYDTRTYRDARHTDGQPYPQEDRRIDNRRSGREDEYPKNIPAVQEKPNKESRKEKKRRENEAVQNLRQAQKEDRQKREEEENRRIREQAEQAIDRDLGNIRKPAKCITVYSAKGGVGKTTIACELAEYLSLVEHGRGHYQVCVVDYNIDFGDVLNTLGLNSNYVCMTQWAAEIEEWIKGGANPKEIQFTQQEVRHYLQKTENGLYALAAPMSNEDSMGISEDSLYVMLDNLIHNGGFDFVVCDTGNNTRDSTMLAIEKADDVLLIVTQNVNTVFCNDTALQTLAKIRMDMNKFRLVINKVQKNKDIGVKTDELKDNMKNPNTGVPYECIAEIEDSNSVRRANNSSEPLVFDSGDKFTSAIGKIAAYEIQEEFVLEVPKKKGFFQKLFGK